MTPQEAMDYIENYTWSTTRLGLERTQELLRRMGNPQKTLKFVHVAGSNGKGSTCAMLDAVLRSAGYRVGLYISPYLQDFCERIQVNGQNIPGEELAQITEQVRTYADAMEDHPSQFELITAIAMQYYAEQHCDIVVLEVGMGGELDSTNVIDCPEAAVITNIGLEHTEYLGSTLEEIAAAKGGIIKDGGVAVCYDSDPAVMETLQRICKRRHAEYRVSTERDIRPLRHSLEGQSFIWKDKEHTLSLLGRHQLRNAGVVLETLEVLREKGWSIPDTAVAEGLSTVRWPARFEVLWRDPLFILDGGHNPQCAQALAANIEDYLLPDPKERSAAQAGEKLTFLIGVLADKNYREMLQLIVPYAKNFICVTPDSPRALRAEALAEEIGSVTPEEVTVTACSSIEEGVRLALEEASTVIAFGSLYLAGHVRTLFPKLKKKQQRRAVLLKRDALPPEKRAADSQRICEKLTATEEYRRAKTVFLFRAIRSEADLSAFADRAKRDGKELAYPYCEDCTHMLALKPGNEWEKDRFGIPAPVRELAEVCEPTEIDLVLCPCTAFDEEGRRLGMGAGYYDRFLKKCTRAYKILVAFEAQRLDRVCTEDFDVPMDAVITEA